MLGLPARALEKNIIFDFPNIKLKLEIGKFQFIWLIIKPPENSRYSSPDVFTQNENDVISLNNNYIIGDFNNRSANLNDFIDISENGNFENEGIF